MKTGLKATLCLALSVTVCGGAGAAMGAPEKAKAEEFTERALYYVDCGNFTTEWGGTVKANRGEPGNYTWLQTPTMAQKGYVFANGPDTSSTLYNSYTDMAYGTDHNSQKNWGFSASEAWNNGWQWWRHALTGSTADAYDSCLYAEVGEAPIVYKFEVDDDTTLLKVNIGTRTIDGWAPPPSYSADINGEAATVSQSAVETCSTFYTTGVKSEEDNKYYVTLSLGNETDMPFVNWIEIKTTKGDDGYQEEPYGYAVQGEAPRLYKSDESEFAAVTLTPEEQAKIDNAAPFSKVTVTYTFGERAAAECTVTVLPKGTVRFINVGGTGDGKLLEDDILTFGNAWDMGVFSKSLRYNAEGMVEIGNLAEGNYGVTVGCYLPDAQGWVETCKYTVLLNGEAPVTVNGAKLTETNGTAFTSLTAGDMISVSLKGVDALPVVTYILVYRTDDEVVTFDSDGGSAVAAMSFAKGGSLSLAEIVPSKENYVFDGWYQGDAKVESMTASGKLTARWTGVPLTVGFETNGGSTVAPIEVAYNSYATAPTPPTKAGHTFKGWFIDEELGISFDFEAEPVTEEMTLYAKWEIVNYTVSFETNGGFAVTSVEVPYNSKATAPAAPAKEGYNFVGWYTDEACTAAFDFDTPITSATTLYAKWEAVKYTVSFVTGGGSAVASIEVPYNTKATAPAAPTKEGYTFVGWFTDEACTAAFDFDTPITSAATLYAKWEEKAPEGMSTTGKVLIAVGSVAGVAAVAAVVIVLLKKRSKK